MLQENPIWNGKASSKDVREPDAYEQWVLRKIKALALDAG
jgi:hypothetical protein